jgi:hypothetical protein|tara:strand:+ start:71 stop:679 length:609 start_codon:yes stop_codon:yes gene_type:complete
MKTYHQDVRDEFYRDHTFAVDLIEIQIQNGSGASDCLYLASGGIDIAFDSTTAPDAGTNTYSAQGEFISYTAIDETFDVVVGKFQITLSGLPSGYIDKFIGKNVEGQRIVVYKAFMDLNAFTIIQSPILMYDGTIYNVAIQENQNTCTIGLDITSQFADFERTAGRKTNNWSNWYFQDAKYDTAMEKTGYVGNTEFLWGRTE